MRDLPFVAKGVGFSERNMQEKKEEGWWELVRTVIYAVIIALGIRTIAFEPFNIPSGSMKPTLLVGDYLFVSKYAYGYSRHSLPFSIPLFNGRLFERPVERGDVAVFKWPFDNRTDYIKRILGLPGDRVQMKSGVLFLNGKPVKRERVEDFVDVNEAGFTQVIPQYRETLGDGVSYFTLDREPDNPVDNTPVYIVPEGHYFAMGDNRDNSQDSRYPSSPDGVGFVPAENLVGRAEVLFFSTDGTAKLWEIWRWIPAARFERFFNSLR